MKFSVIIPVYNTPERYLRECLESALSQSYEGVEYLIFDDGSKTETADLLDALVKQEEKRNVRVLHESHCGLGAARNHCMKMAKGDYIVFLDSDDYWLSKDFLKDCNALLEESKADILSLEYVEFFSSEEKPTYKTGHLKREAVFNKAANEAKRALLKSPRCAFSSCAPTKILKKQYISKSNIRFLENTYHEDAYFTALCLLTAQTFDRYNYSVYAVRRANPHSMTATNDGAFRSVTAMITVFDKIFEEIGTNEVNKNPILLDFLASPYAYWLAKLGRMSTDLNEVEIRKMFGYARVLNYSSRLSVRLVGKCVNVLGIEKTIRLLRLFFTLNKKSYLSVNRKTDQYPARQ